MAWDENLAEPHLTIARHDGTPLWVLAGPGTGKTFALMRRVARVLETGIDPPRILVVTLTRTGARDLVTQLNGLQVNGATEVDAGTLHSLCFRLLYQAHVLRATNRTPRTLNDFETELILLDLRDTRFGGKKEKKRMLRAFEAAWARLQHEQPGWPTRPVDRDFHNALHRWLQFHEGMLVGELIPITLAYLRTNPHAPEHNLYQHVIVDEYQDLNRADQTLLDLLSTNSEFCVVGDDDQSIYSFRYAHPEGISEFPNTHQNVHPETLTVCRRCPRQIIQMANSLISNNVRIQRDLLPIEDSPQGEVWGVQWNNLNEEANGIAQAVQHAVNVRTVPPQEIVILVNRRPVGYMIRDAIRGLGLPVQSYFTEQSLESELAQEKFTLLNLMVNPDDRVALRCWLAFRSSNGLPGAYQNLMEHCEATAEPPRSCLGRLSQGELNLPGTARLVQRFRSLQTELATLRNLRGVEFLEAWLPPDQEDLNELRNITLRIIQETDEPAQIYRQLHYNITQPESPEPDNNIRVMSLHKSKGLTARFVVVACCIEGVIPHVNRDLPIREQEEQMQEQRRLFYVSTTRTTETFIVSAPLYIDIAIAHRIYAGGRRRVGNQLETVFSQFYEEFGDSAPQIIQGEDFLARFMGVEVEP